MEEKSSDLTKTLQDHIKRCEQRQNKGLQEVENNLMIEQESTQKTHSEESKATLINTNQNSPQAEHLSSSSPDGQVITRKSQVEGSSEESQMYFTANEGTSDQVSSEGRLGEDMRGQPHGVGTRRIPVRQTRKNMQHPLSRKERRTRSHSVRLIWASTLPLSMIW
jgi:hypothetical protein